MDKEIDKFEEAIKISRLVIDSENLDLVLQLSKSQNLVFEVVFLVQDKYCELLTQYKSEIDITGARRQRTTSFAKLKTIRNIDSPIPPYEDYVDVTGVELSFDIEDSDFQYLHLISKKIDYLKECIEALKELI